MKIHSALCVLALGLQGSMGLADVSLKCKNFVGSDSEISKGLYNFKVKRSCEIQNATGDMVAIEKAVTSELLKEKDAKVLKETRKTESGYSGIEYDMKRVFDTPHGKLPVACDNFVGRSAKGVKYSLTSKGELKGKGKTKYTKRISESLRYYTSKKGKLKVKYEKDVDVKEPRITMGMFKKMTHRGIRKEMDIVLNKQKETLKLAMKIAAKSK